MTRRTLLRLSGTCGLTAAFAQDAVDQARTLAARGKTSLIQGDFKLAKQSFERALKLFGSHPERSHALIGLAALDVQQRNYSSALAKLGKAMDGDPSAAAAASLWMGIARRGDGKLGLAEMHFWEAVVFQDPNQAEDVAILKESYGDFLAQAGRSGEARSIFDCIGILRPDRPKVEAPIFELLQVDLKPRTLVYVRPTMADRDRAGRANGTMVLTAVIQLDGRPHDAQVSQSLHPKLDQVELDAWSQSRYLPAMKDARRVACRIHLPMNFNVTR